MEPMDVARQLVALTKEKDALDAQVKSLEERIKPLKQIVLDLISEGKLSESFRCEGRNIHIHKQVWAGPKDGHAELAAVLEHLGLVEYLPSTVNSQKISAYVREALDPNELLDLEDRLASPEPRALEPELLQALKVTERADVRVVAS